MGNNNNDKYNNNEIDNYTENKKNFTNFNNSFRNDNKNENKLYDENENENERSKIIQIDKRPSAYFQKIIVEKSKVHAKKSKALINLEKTYSQNLIRTDNTKLKIRNDDKDDEKFGLEWSNETIKNENKSILKNSYKISPSSVFDLFEERHYVLEESKECSSTEMCGEHSFKTGYCQSISGFSTGLNLGLSGDILIANTVDKEKTFLSSGITGPESVENKNENIFIQTNGSTEKLNFVTPQLQKLTRTKVMDLQIFKSFDIAENRNIADSIISPLSFSTPVETPFFSSCSPFFSACADTERMENLTATLEPLSKSFLSSSSTSASASHTSTSSSSSSSSSSCSTCAMPLSAAHSCAVSSSTVRSSNLTLPTLSRGLSLTSQLTSSTPGPETSTPLPLELPLLLDESSCASTLPVLTMPLCTFPSSTDNKISKDDKIYGDDLKDFSQLILPKSQVALHSHVSSLDCSNDPSRHSSFLAMRGERESMTGLTGIDEIDFENQSQNDIEVLPNENANNMVDVSDNIFENKFNNNSILRKNESSYNINDKNVKLNITNGCKYSDTNDNNDSSNYNNNNNDNNNEYDDGIDVDNRLNGYIGQTMTNNKHLHSTSTNTVNTYGSTATNMTNSISSRNRVGSAGLSISSSHTSTSPYGSYSKATRTIFGNNYNSVFLGNSEGLNTPSHMFTGKSCFNYDSRISQLGPRSYVYDNNIIDKNTRNDNNNNKINNNNNDNYSSTYNNYNNYNSNIRVKESNSSHQHENGNQLNKKADGYPDPSPSVSQVYIHGMFSQGTEYSFFLPPQEENKYLGKRVSTSLWSHLFTCSCHLFSYFFFLF